MNFQFGFETVMEQLQRELSAVKHVLGVEINHEIQNNFTLIQIFNSMPKDDLWKLYLELQTKENRLASHLGKFLLS